MEDYSQPPLVSNPLSRYTSLIEPIYTRYSMYGMQLHAAFTPDHGSVS